MDKDCKNFEPSNFFLDNKDGKYYRNTFLNNCKMRMKHLDKIYNYLININNSLEQFEQLEKNKDPYIKTYYSLDILKNNIKNINDDIENIKNYCKEEYIELQSKDYQKIMDDNRDMIYEKESTKETEK